MIFTMPDRLWSYFAQAAALQRVLIEMAVSTVKRYVQLSLGHDVVPGIVAVLHPFGSDLESKSHVHLLVTEGGVTSQETWGELSFFSYDALRKMWQYDILTALRKEFPKDKRLSALVDACFRKYPKGFYVHAKRRIGAYRTQVVRYLARYIRHPCLTPGRRPSPAVGFSPTTERTSPLCIGGTTGSSSRNFRFSILSPKC